MSMIKYKTRTLTRSQKVKYCFPTIQNQRLIRISDYHQSFENQEA